MAHGKFVIKTRYSRIPPRYRKYLGESKSLAREWDEMLAEPKGVVNHCIKTMNETSIDKKNSSAYAMMAARIDFDYNLVNRTFSNYFLETEELYHFLCETRISKSINFGEILNDFVKTTVEFPDDLPSSRIFHDADLNNRVFGHHKGFHLDRCALYRELGVTIKCLSGFIHVPNRKDSLSFGVRLMLDKNGKLWPWEGEDFKTEKELRNVLMNHVNPFDGSGFDILGNNILVSQSLEDGVDDSPLTGMFPIDQYSIQQDYKRLCKSTSKSDKRGRDLMQLVFNLFFYMTAFKDYVKDGTPNPKKNLIDAALVSMRNTTIDVSPFVYDPKRTESGNGGTGTVRCPHFRSGCFKMLRDERFKRDENGNVKIIWVNSTFVHGETKTVLDNEKKEEAFAG
jgi:hypothetical protein